MVWKSTVYLGIARAEGNGRSVIVAQYHPAGNVQTKYAANVSPASYG